MFGFYYSDFKDIMKYVICAILGFAIKWLLDLFAKRNDHIPKCQKCKIKLVFKDFQHALYDRKTVSYAQRECKKCGFKTNVQA